MIFKLDWEKTDITHQLPHGTVEHMLNLVFPEKALQSCSLIAGGCANLNYKIQ